MTKLPPTYDCPAAIARIRNGLVALGCPEERAEWAALRALDEAPFAAPSEEGWNIACQRARWLAHTGQLEGEGFVPIPDGIRLRD